MSVLRLTTCSLWSKRIGNPALCLSLSQPAEVAPGSPTYGPFKESSTFVAANGTVFNGTRGPLNSSFGSVGVKKTMANSNYNSLEINIRQQLGPLELMFAYNYGKSIDQSSSLAEPLNPVDYALSRAISAFDMKHSVVLSYQYNLPFARFARRWARFTGGWSLPASRGLVRTCL